MIITIIDNEIVAKKCSRSYMKFNMAFRKNDRNFNTFAIALDLDDITDEERRSYGRLKREFKKKTGIDIKLSVEHTTTTVQKIHNWSNAKMRFMDSFGQNAKQESFAIPLWITEIKLSPELRQLKARVMIDNERSIKKEKKR